MRRATWLPNDGSGHGTARLEFKEAAETAEADVLRELNTCAAPAASPVSVWQEAGARRGPGE
jgi:hypothetical protein